MAEQFYYHAPDDRIYGPADRAKLLLWQQEGRLTPASRLRPIKAEEFTTWAEVQSTSEPEPEPSAPFPLPLIEPPFISARPEPICVSSPRALVVRACTVFSQIFAPLCLISAVTQLPFFFMSYRLHQLSMPQLEQTLQGFSYATLGFYAAVLASAFLLELGLAALTKLTAQHLGGEIASIPTAFRSVRGHAGQIISTYFLRGLIVGLFCSLALLPVSIGSHLSMTPTDAMRVLLLFFTLVLLLPCLILLLRFLLTTQAIVLENQKGLGALRRSLQVVSLATRPGFFRRGEFRFALVLLFPFMLTLTMREIISVLVSMWPEAAAAAQFQLILQLMEYASATLITPFYAILLVLFYRENARIIAPPAPIP